MKVIIAGGRDFTDIQRMRDELNQIPVLIDNFDDLKLICGMARGADMTGAKLFNELGLPIRKVPADWQDMSPPLSIGTNAHGTYNKLAGMKRNVQMGNMADMLVAFWNGKSTGTKHMIDYMKRLKKPVYIVRY